MNITSKNGLRLLQDFNKSERKEKDYVIVYVFSDGGERSLTFDGLRLSQLSRILEDARKNKDVVKVEIFECTVSSSTSVKPLHCVDTAHKFEPKRSRTSYLRTRTIR